MSVSTLGGSAESAERFLNDIKAIFGVPHCLYLVSVSDDALTAFDKRAFVARTAFDSAFDDVISVSYLAFEAAKNLLRARVAGLPDPMIAACHVISGGLPRDLMPHLLDSTWPGESSTAMLSAIENDLSQPSAPPGLTAALYFYATVAEAFGPGLQATTASLPTCPTGNAASIDCLAHTRHALSGNPDIAWELSTRFRAARNLAVPAPPWRATGPIEPPDADTTAPARTRDPPSRDARSGS